jgi:hypothetical protein
MTTPARQVKVQPDGGSSRRRATKLLAQAAFGWKLMLQEMQEHDHEVAFDSFVRAAAQILDLLDQIADVEALESPCRRNRACSSSHRQKSRS